MDAERDVDYQRPQGLPETTHVRIRRCKLCANYITDLDTVLVGRELVVRTGHLRVIS